MLNGRTRTMDLAERSTFSILVVDDDPDYINMLTAGFNNAGYSHCTGVLDSAALPDAFDQLRPDLILLDLYMPNTSGWDLLRQWRNNKDQQEILPVIAITGDTRDSTRHAALKLGATDFITKVVDIEEVILRAGNLLQMRALYLQAKEYATELEDKVRLRTQETIRAQMALVDRLGTAVEARDGGETMRHSNRVGDVAAMIAERLGRDKPEISLIRRAAPLHDIGKIGVPDSVLNKPGRLSPDEFEAVKQHTVIGHRILAGTGFPLLELAAEIAIAHHENWDGTGYPAGLKGEEIPFSARLAALADVYEALTSERPYKRAWTHEEAVKQVESYKHTKFAPEVVDAFLDFATGISGSRRQH